ncbi:MAG TPA: N(2)-fixation sustaining protein CowN [Geopsychrobacteraceae bacterium]|nr:N(2)-fixation sustaining protein CowN [Geopsychrobacteraceae bacterium]
MTTDSTDRYVTYANIDCAGNAKKLMKMLRRHIDLTERSNAFWEKFKQMLDRIDNPAGTEGRKIDEIFLIHTYINNLYEVFEEYEDTEALALLDRIERECC